MKKLLIILVSTTMLFSCKEEKHFSKTELLTKYNYLRRLDKVIIKKEDDLDVLIDEFSNMSAYYERIFKQEEIARCVKDINICVVEYNKTMTEVNYIFCKKIPNFYILQREQYVHVCEYDKFSSKND